MGGKERGPQIPPAGRHAHLLCHHLPRVASAQKILARLHACVKVGKLQQNNLSRLPTAVAETTSTHNPHTPRPHPQRAAPGTATLDTCQLLLPHLENCDLELLFSLFGICNPSLPGCVTPLIRPICRSRRAEASMTCMNRPMDRETGQRGGLLPLWLQTRFPHLALRVIETGTAPIPIRPRPNPQSPADIENPSWNGPRQPETVGGLERTSQVTEAAAQTAQRPADVSLADSKPQMDVPG